MNILATIMANIGGAGNVNYERYRQSFVNYENSYKTARLGLTPERWPSLEYNYARNEESNDPVTGTAIKRVINRDSAELNYRLGNLSTSAKGTLEKWTSHAPSEEVTDYKRVNFGLATVGLEKFTFASNVELEDRIEPAGTTPYRKTYKLNLSATPAKQYFVSTSVEYQEDSAQGTRNVTDLSFRAEPSEALRAEGKYTIASVSEVYATVETVAKNSGSFSLDFRPTRYLRTRYLYKPNFTRILRTDTISYNNEQSQYDLNIIPLQEIMLGLIYKTGHGFNISSQDYSLRQNTADTDSTLYTLKMAPFRIFSTEFNYQIDNGRGTQLITAEPVSYIPGRSFGKKIDVAVKTSLSERFSVDSRYTYQRSTQGSGEAEANILDGASHTASLKGIWNISDVWSASLNYAYTKASNNLVPSPVTYTNSPGFGVIYREGDRLRVDFDYTYSRSYSGADTEKTNYSLRAKYSLSDYVNVTIRGEREISRLPDYRLTDISGNVEINL